MKMQDTNKVIPVAYHNSMEKYIIVHRNEKHVFTIYKIDNHKLTCSKCVDVASPFRFLFRHRSHHTYSLSREWGQKSNIQIPVVCCNVVLKSNIYILILKNRQNFFQCNQNENRNRN